MSFAKRLDTMRAHVVHPVRLLPVTFMAAWLLGTGMLLLPFAKAGDGGADVLPAAFTSASAITVTGLTVVDTSTYWSPAGQVMILVLCQAGGFGIMAFATMLGLLVGGRLGLRTRLVAQEELHAINLGDLGHVLRRVAVTMLVLEAVVAAALAGRFFFHYDESLGTSLWHGVFHAISAVNNAGFTLTSDSITGYVGDLWIVVPVCVAVILGGIGFPVLAELFREWHRSDQWTVHTRLTVWGSLVLLAVALLAFSLVEWTNPLTLGGMDRSEKLSAVLTGGVMPRSGGFNVIDYSQVRPETMAFTDMLMFIGGGSASTAGGIRVTTFFLLFFVIWAEIRGREDVTIGIRRIPMTTIRQAITIALLGVAAVLGTMLFVVWVSDAPTGYVLFDVMSAFGTVGLSTGVTSTLPAAGQIAIMAMMMFGRVGIATTVAALGLRTTPRRYRLPEERPIIG